MRRKEEKSKQGQANKKAKQYSTPKAVTFPGKNELPRVGLEPTTLYTLHRMPYQLSYQGSTGSHSTPDEQANHQLSMSQKKLPCSVPFRFSSRFNRSGPFRTVPFTSVLTVYRGQTVLALGMNSSAKFTVCVGEA